MPMLNREGRFRATPIEAEIGKSKNGAAFVAVKFAVNDEYDRETSEWVDVDRRGEDVTVWHYWTNREGVIVEGVLSGMKDAYCWDGVSLGYFGPDNINNVPPVQIETQFEEYQGRNRLKVKWVNRYDSEGGKLKWSNDAARELANAYGAQLRAQAGASGAARALEATAKSIREQARAERAAAKPAEAPAPAPATTTPRPSMPAPPSAPQLDGDGVWDWFLSETGKTLDDAARAESFTRAVAKVCDDTKKTEGAFTPDDWKAVQHELRDADIPF